MDQRAQNRKSVPVTVLGVSSLQHCAQLLIHPVLHLKINVREERDTEINFRVCMYVCFMENDVPCLRSVQEEGHSPVQPGCSGLCSPDEKVHSGHVNMNISQELET